MAGNEHGAGLAGQVTDKAAQPVHTLGV
jgi:hypothetical protein